MQYKWWQHTAALHANHVALSLVIHVTVVYIQPGATCFGAPAAGTALCLSCMCLRLY